MQVMLFRKFVDVRARGPSIMRIAAFLVVVASSLLGLWSPAVGKLAELRFASTSGRQAAISSSSTSMPAASPRLDYGLGRAPFMLNDRQADGTRRVRRRLRYRLQCCIDAGEDQALATSLSVRGGYVYLASFQQTDARAP